MNKLGTQKSLESKYSSTVASVIWKFNIEIPYNYTWPGFNKCIFTNTRRLISPVIYLTNQLLPAQPFTTGYYRCLFHRQGYQVMEKSVKFCGFAGQLWPLRFYKLYPGHVLVQSRKRYPTAQKLVQRVLYLLDLSPVYLERFVLYYIVPC